MKTTLHRPQGKCTAQECECHTRPQSSIDGLVTPQTGRHRFVLRQRLLSALRTEKRGGKSRFKHGDLTYPLMFLGAGKYRSDDRPTWIVRWIAYFLKGTFKRTGCADKQVRWVCTKSCMTTTRTTRHHAPSRKPIGCVQLHIIDTRQSQCLHAVELESVLVSAALLRMFDFTTTNCMW